MIPFPLRYPNIQFSTRPTCLNKPDIDTPFSFSKKLYYIPESPAYLLPPTLSSTL